MMVNFIGERVEHWRAMPCTCYDPGKNWDRQRDCDQCSHGYRYDAPRTLQALVTNQRRWFVNPEIGWVAQSELHLTLPPGDDRLGRFDKAVLLARVSVATERMSRGNDTLPHLRPVRVLRVVEGDTAYNEGTDYTVDLSTRGITWLTDGPERVYAVQYEYRPEYWFAAAEERQPRPSGLGGPLAATYTLTLQPPDA
jgi:hypothetical protein